MRPTYKNWIILSIIWVVTGCSGASTDGGLSTENATIPSETRPVASLTAGNIVQELSKTVCERLTSCCNQTDQNEFFSNFIDDERLAELAPNMPPNTPLTAESCPVLLEELYPQIWLGSWLERVEAREVIFDADGAQACMANLQNAACGQDVRDALFDTTCFSNIPPGGGEEQRKMFSRLPRLDEACAPIRDGFGGLYFGSCDPNRSFCCVEEESLDGGCTPFPVPGKVGTCKPTSALGESCNDMPLQLCETGLYCDDEDFTCNVDTWEPLALGQTCLDESFMMIGDCTNSYCSWDEGVCMALKAKGDTCNYSFECSTDFCDADTLKCGEDPRCEMP